jgi:hypothetical protein
MLKKILEETNSETVNQWEIETPDFSNLNHPDMCWLTPTPKEASLTHLLTIVKAATQGSFPLTCFSHFVLNFHFLVV